MKVAAFQFKGSGIIEDNLLAIQRGIAQAAEQNVQFLITHECALCGYPPVDIESIHQVDFQQQAEAIDQISQLAAQYQMAIGLGVILPAGRAWTNSVLILFPQREQRVVYHKRALWGWDLDHFAPGQEQGIFTVAQVKMGVRICFEVRFPEYFRELFRQSVDIAFVSLNDVSEEPSPIRYELIKSHLVTRAVENAMYVVSVNSTAKYQSAPTCVINPDGMIEQIAPPDGEYLISLDYEPLPPGYGRKGRIHLSRELQAMSQNSD